MWGLAYERDPWGEIRADLRSALICSTIGNYAGRVRSGKAPPLKPTSFMPFLKGAEAEKPKADVIDPGDWFRRL